MSFRLLRADEIECRVAMVKNNGVSLLLYKDARVDQNILDEAVGPYNWQKTYSRDNRNCTVSLWDESKKQWISKEDTGTESNTEAEKGLASDSFKRACFCWGIGRELYTAPFIWITAKDATIVDGKKCYDRFLVSEIGYDERRNINRLTIVKAENGRERVVYRMGAAAEKPKDEGLTEPMVNSLRGRIRTKGISELSVLTTYHRNSFKELTVAEYKDAMDKLEGMPDRR